MTITLYNIPAISTTNGIYFESEQDRHNKLQQFKLFDIEEGFYPPFSTNKIKVSNQFGRNIDYPNYLSINFRNKDFYYFIDNYEYINENMFYYNISMDVITTFYFDINFRRFERTRSNEFKNIRDNISKEDTFYLDYLNKPLENRPYLLIIRFKDRLADKTASYLYNLNFNNLPTTVFNKQIETDENRVYSDGLKTLIMPLPWLDYNENSIINVRGYYSDSDDYSNIHSDRLQTISFNYNPFLIECLQEDPNVFLMYITKVYPYGISWVPSQKTLRINDSYYTLCNNRMIVPIGSHYASHYWFTSLIEIKSSTSIDFSLDSPELTDTNYRKVLFGELNDLKEIPLEYIEKDLSPRNISIDCILDVSTGTRIYKPINDILNDMNIIQICNSVETLPLYNDNYNIYMAQNKGTLTTGVALQKTKFTVNALNQYFNQNAATTFRGALTGGVPGGIVAGVESTINTSVSLWDNFYTLEQQLQANKENALYAPDTQKMGNNFSVDLNFGLIEPVIANYKVGDYDDISEARNFIGYPAHEILNNITLNNAKGNPYNDKYLVMGETEVFTTCYNNREICMRIKERIRSGIKLYTDISKLGT